MNMNPVNEQIVIHSTPLEGIHLNNDNLEVEFDDVNEQRWKFIFNPYQALKITTIDCIDTIPLLIGGRRPLNVLEVNNSTWITYLKEELLKKDSEANFLDKARHYIFPFQDNIIEIVAWENYEILKV